MASNENNQGKKGPKRTLFIVFRERIFDPLYARDQAGDKTVDFQPWLDFLEEYDGVKAEIADREPDLPYSAVLDRALGYMWGRHYPHEPIPLEDEPEDPMAAMPVQPKLDPITAAWVTVLGINLERDLQELMRARAEAEGDPAVDDAEAEPKAETGADVEEETSVQEVIQESSRTSELRPPVSTALAHAAGRAAVEAAENAAIDAVIAAFGEDEGELLWGVIGHWRGAPNHINAALSSREYARRGGFAVLGSWDHGRNPHLTHRNPNGWYPRW